MCPLYAVVGALTLAPPGLAAISKSQVVVAGQPAEGQRLFVERSLRRLPLEWQTVGTLGEPHYGVAVFNDHNLVGNTAYVYRLRLVQNDAKVPASETAWTSTLGSGPGVIGPDVSILQATNLMKDRDTGTWHAYPLEGMPPDKTLKYFQPAGRLANYAAQLTAQTELNLHPIRINLQFADGRTVNIRGTGAVRRVLRAFRHSSRLSDIQMEPGDELAPKDYVWVFVRGSNKPDASFAVIRGTLKDNWGKDVERALEKHYVAASERSAKR